MKMIELQSKLTMGDVGYIYHNNGNTFLMVVRQDEKMMILNLRTGEIHLPGSYRDDYTCIGRLSFNDLHTELTECIYES